MAEIDLVVTDLDGTLWPHEGVLYPTVLEAWRSLEAKGIPILVATGRRPASTRVPLARLGLDAPAVLLDGSLGIDFSTGERFICQSIPPAVAARILAVFEDQGLSPVVYVDADGADLRVTDHCSTNPGILASYGDDAVLADLDEVAASGSVLAFGLVGVPCEITDAVAAAVLATGVGDARVNPSYDWGGCALTIVRPGVSKWDGIVAYCTRYGLDPTRILAIGDGSNDVEMLEHAAVACSLEGSNPLALAAADQVVPSASSGGWAELLAFI